MAGPVVHIVDDDAGSRKGTARLIESAGLMARSYESARAFLGGIETESPGCVVLDVRMPEIDGLELQAELARRGVPLPIVFVTAHGEICDSVRAIQCGAVDFLTKPVDGRVLLAAVQRALAHDRALRAERVRRRMLRSRYDRLTARERQVLLHLISGQLNKEVAVDLQITERTIKLHRARVLDKLEVNSMVELARLAVELGIDPAVKPS